jgi:hypothetical protein
MCKKISSFPDGMHHIHISCGCSDVKCMLVFHDKNTSRGLSGRLLVLEYTCQEYFHSSQKSSVNNQLYVAVAAITCFLLSHIEPYHTSGYN